MSTKISSEKIHEIGKHIEDTHKQIKKNAKDIEATTQRLEKSANKFLELTGQYESSRQNRQKILAAGKDSSEITRLIKDIRAEIEEKEDEQTGLQNRLEALRSEKNQLENAGREAGKELLRTKLQVLVPKYNKTAFELSEIVKEIWDLKCELHDPSHAAIGSSMGWTDNALEVIPELTIPGEEVGRYSFFHYHTYRQEKMNEAEAQ